MKELISFEAFISYIREHILDGWQEERTIKIEEIAKRNGVVYTGIMLRKEGRKTTPVCYLDELYEAYCDGMPLEMCIHTLRGLYEEAEETADQLERCRLFDFSEMKHRIVYCLENYERNQKILQDSPHIRLYDLAITFACVVNVSEKELSTLRVSNKEMQMWDTNIHELLLHAMENTRRIFPEKLVWLPEFLEENDDRLDVEEFAGDNDIYILSNEAMTHGASAILYKNVLREFAFEYASNFYILPSSVHEVILVPDEGLFSAEKLQEIVKEVNEKILTEEQYLSDSVYYYDVNEDRVICCCT